MDEMNVNQRERWGCEGRGAKSRRLRTAQQSRSARVLEWPTMKVRSARRELRWSRRGAMAAAS